MLLGGLDFETSGENPKTTSVVEAGLVMWCTDLHRPVWSMGFLVLDPDAVWEQGAIDSHGITQEQCLAFGVHTEPALKRVISLIQGSEVVCAHNGITFDRVVYETWCDKLGYFAWKEKDKTWIDTMMDVPYPRTFSRKLKYLAAEHNIPHYHAHGALPDATIMMEILDRYPLEKVLESARSPVIVIEALVSFDDKEKAKMLGYHWVPDSKQWVKSIKEVHMPDEVEDASKVGFNIRRLRERL